MCSCLCFGLCEACSCLLCPIFQLWCVGLDFSSPVSASNVQSARSGASVWTFQVLFLPATSNLTALSRRFGLLKSCFYPQRPIFQLRRVILDLSSLIPASNVHSARSDSTVWTFQVHFLPETSNPPQSPINSPQLISVTNTGARKVI